MQQPRRTFAIIAHPDAGKTTLSEHLLLEAGAIHLAGAVKTRKSGRKTRSDFMKIEQDRGISVVSSVMSFLYEGCLFNLLDTPGHEDFSEDTYRTLTAVDAVIMVLDAAKGIEPQTLKLFEVCRLRDIPILTFINKIDRESRDAIALLDDIESQLALKASPRAWPLYAQDYRFEGVFDFATQHVERLERKEHQTLDRVTVQDILKQNADMLALAQEGYDPFELKDFLEGHMSPVYFGSALYHLGVKCLIDAMVKYAPPPKPRKAHARIIKPDEKDVSGFIFKIQANMDPAHHDRMAFMRICSGVLCRGDKLKVHRNKKWVTLQNLVFFFAAQRQTIEEAYPGDIVGIPNHQTLAIGDTLTQGEDIVFEGFPCFAPEILKIARALDPSKGKRLKTALQALAQEGVLQLFSTHRDERTIIGLIGPLQLDVLKARLLLEYRIDVVFEDAPFQTLRWIEAQDANTLKEFEEKNTPQLAKDERDNNVFMAKSAWEIDYTLEKNPGIQLKTTNSVKF